MNFPVFLKHVICFCTLSLQKIFQKNMKRILLKLSGEALGLSGFSLENVNFLADEVLEAKKNTDTEIAIVLGGGNIWRGRDSKEFGFFPADSDAVGMGATILNAVVFKRILQKKGQKTRVYSPIEASLLAKKHNPDLEIESLEKGEIILLAGGTGSPFFTTDTTAVLRALEIRADAVFKGTKVSGVFDSDPNKNSDAKKYDSLTFQEALKKNLKVMDATAFALAKENEMPIFVFNAFEKGAILRAVRGEQEGTWVK